MQQKQAMGEMFSAIAVASISVIFCYAYTKYMDPRRLFKDYQGVGAGFSNTTWALYYASFENDKHDKAWTYWSNDLSITLRDPIPKTYPLEGYYSSKNNTLLKRHMQYLHSAGIQAIIVPWFSSNRIDPRTNKKRITDKALSKIVGVAESYNIKVAIMIPEYKNRTWVTIRQDIKRYNSLYSGRSSILRTNRRPVIFIEKAGKLEKSMYFLTTSRRTYFDSYYVAHVSTIEDIKEATESGYDAICPLYGDEKYSWATNSSHWPTIKELTRLRAMTFIPVVTPGNFETSRNGGKYYEERWETALKYNNHVFIDSFNGWFDGTNIEPAISTEGHKLDNYNWNGKDPNAFISITKQFAQKIAKFNNNLFD